MFCFSFDIRSTAYLEFCAAETSHGVWARENRPGLSAGNILSLPGPARWWDILNLFVFGSTRALAILFRGPGKREYFFSFNTFSLLRRIRYNLVGALACSACSRPKWIFVAKLLKSATEKHDPRKHLSSPNCVANIKVTAKRLYYHVGITNHERSALTGEDNSSFVWPLDVGM